MVRSFWFFWTCLVPRKVISASQQPDVTRRRGDLSRLYGWNLIHRFRVLGVLGLGFRIQARGTFLGVPIIVGHDLLQSYLLPWPR